MKKHYFEFLRQKQPNMFLECSECCHQKKIPVKFANTNISFEEQLRMIASTYILKLLKNTHEKVQSSKVTGFRIGHGKVSLVSQVLLQLLEIMRLEGITKHLTLIFEWFPYKRSIYVQLQAGMCNLNKIYLCSGIS